MLRSLRNLVNKKRENNQNNQNNCKKCGEKYTNAYYKWCKPCVINDLKIKFTSGNENIDNFIQEIQLKMENSYNIGFEWIPYNQFSNINEIGRGGFATVYSAIWEGGPLEYKYDYDKIMGNM